MKKIVILGSTGSIGKAAVEIASNWRDDFEVVGLAAKSNIGELEKQLALFGGAKFFLDDRAALGRLLERDSSLKARNTGCGAGGMEELITDSAPDLVVNALVGISGLKPTVSALGEGRSVALANKETLVAAGALVMEMAAGRENGIIPVDSEHFSLSRCLRGNALQTDEIVLTASGGPFLGRRIGELSSVTVREVLDHPTWKMGPKVTVDSAHLINKGLEVIEAHWLFGFDYERIKVVIHPQSVVHSMIRMKDGSFLAHMAPADMRLPLMNAMYHPAVLPYPWRNLDLGELGKLEFLPMDHERFPGFGLAMEAASAGGTAPAVLNAADEEAVEAFLAGRIGFMNIVDWIEEALGAHKVRKASCIDDVLEADSWAREFLRERHGGSAGE